MWSGLLFTLLTHTNTATFRFAGDTSMCSLLTTRRSCRYISVIFKLLFPTVNLTPLNHCLTGSPQAKTVLNFYMKLPHARVSDREFKASFFRFVKSTSMELTIKTKVRLSSYVEDKDFPITGLCGRTRNTMSNVTVSCCGCVCLCVCVCFEGWRSCWNGVTQDKKKHASSNSISVQWLVILLPRSNHHQMHK